MEYTVLTDVTGTTTYIGQTYPGTDAAKSSTIWKIFRVTEGTSGVTCFYADQVSTFTKQWTERVNYNYSAA